MKGDRRPRRRLGRDGRSWLAAALGGPASGWELEDAALGERGLEFSLVNGPRRLELELVRDGGDRVRLARRGAGEAEEERGILAAAAAAAAAETFTALLARLGRDALLYADPRCGAPSRFESYYRRVDHAADFGRFVHPQARFLEQEIGFGARYAKVSHATLECRLNNPQLTLDPLRFFADEPRPRSEKDDASYADTTITEADVLAGRTQEVLTRELERVAREERPAFIHLKTTCLPELVGDNPSSVIERLAKDGVPVLWTSKTREPAPMYAAALERMLGGGAVARDPRAVLLAGIPTPEAEREARELLGALGLRVVGTVFPRLDAAPSAASAEAGAVVWLDPCGWAKIDDAVFFRNGLRVVRTHPPYGVAGGKAWLERVASVLGVEGAGPAWAAALAARADALEAVRAETRGRVVALAGDRADLEKLTAPGHAFGFSVAGLLCELGFRVRCLVSGGGPESRRAEAPSGAGTLAFVPFATPAGLERELGRGVDLAFSHFAHDPRLEARGLLGFTERAFEPGLDGLLRSGRRLLERCAGRPFPRHRAMLRRSA